MVRKANKPAFESFSSLVWLFQEKVPAASDGGGWRRAEPPACRRGAVIRGANPPSEEDWQHVTGSQSATGPPLNHWRPFSTEMVQFVDNWYSIIFIFNIGLSFLSFVDTDFVRSVFLPNVNAQVFFWAFGEVDVEVYTVKGSHLYTAFGFVNIRGTLQKPTFLPCKTKKV